MSRSTWKIGAQLSTSHTALRSLPAARIAAILDTALATVPLDIVAAGTREAGEVFALVCEFGRERGYSSYLWYNLLSDVVGSEPSELVVDFEGRPSSGWGTWDGGDDAAHETFRFICPNNPTARARTLGQIAELLTRYAFDGLFLDKCRFPSPANGFREVLSCFCDHCHRAASARGLDLSQLARTLRDGAIFDQLGPDRPHGPAERGWVASLVTPTSLLGRFMKFRTDSITGLIAEVKALTQRLGRVLALDLFTAGLAPIVGQDYARLSTLTSWTKPMTYRKALGPASLRLEIPSLCDGLAEYSGIQKGRIEDWASRHVPGFPSGLLAVAERDRVPLSLVGAEIAAAVRQMGKVPVYAGVETLSYPGVIDIDPRTIRDMVGAARANGARGVIASWDLVYTPEENLAALRGDA